jgi:hypothetical protein
MSNHRRLPFILQEDAVRTEVGWLEHQAQMAIAADCDLADQVERLTALAQRIQSVADSLRHPVKLKSVA